MISRCIFSVSLTSVIMLTAAHNISLAAEQHASVSRSTAIAISIALKQDKIPIGEKPIAVLTVKNISSHDVAFPTALYNFRIRVKGANGEPPLTMFQRHQRGIYMPGDKGALRDGGVTLDVAPGASQSQAFDLSRYYNFSAPGKYTVSIEYLDESGKWLRTHKVQFEMISPTQ